MKKSSNGSIKDWFTNIFGINRIVSLISNVFVDTMVVSADVAILKEKTVSMQTRIDILEKVVFELNLKRMQEDLEDAMLQFELEQVAGKSKKKTKITKKTNKNK